MANKKASVRRVVTTSQREMSALAQALVPVAKLCMKSGLGAGELQVAAKIACINVAAESAKIGNRLNQSRIAAITGLTRKEVRSLFDAAKSGRTAAAKDVAKQRTTRVLHGWQTDPDYKDRRGYPLPLAFRGTDLSFQTLVRRYAGDVTPVSVLNELVRAGAVSVDGNRQVKVTRTTPRAKGYGPEAVTVIAKRLRDLGLTLVGNIERAETPIFEGFGEIPNLSAEDAALFRFAFSDRAASLVHDVELWRAAQTRIRSKKRSKDSARHRVGLGVYLVSQEAPAEPTHVKTAMANKEGRKTVMP